MISEHSEPRAFLSFTSAAGGNRFWQIAIPLFFLTSFFLVSRVLDLTRFLDPRDKYFRVIAVLLLALAICLVAGRRALVFWKSAAGRVLPFFAAWVTLTYFMTQHSEASFLYWQNTVQGSLLFLAAAGLLTTLADFRKFFATLACAGLTACALGIVWGTVRNGRFALRAGPYSDPNYYAMFLLALAPVIWVLFARKPLWIRLCGMAATALPLLLAVRTISRGGFVGMLAMLLVVFFLSSIKMRILIASLSVVTLVVLLAFLPAALRSRLAAAARITSSDANQQPGEEGHIVADNSTVARQTLLGTGIALTLENPLFGVGPGNFGSTVVEFGKTQGLDWAPLNTHNSYTQISSETGIPGVILFLLLIFFSVKNVVSVLRQTSFRGANPDPELHLWAAALLVSFAALFTCMFFLSEGYNLMLYFWLGIASGLKLLLPEPPREEEEFVEI